MFKLIKFKKKKYLMNTKKQIALLLFLIVLPPFIIFLSRLLFPANYFFSSIYKIIYLSPLLFRIYIEKKTLKKSLFENFSLKNFKKNILSTIIIGAFLATFYISSFVVLNKFLDLQIIIDKLQVLISLNLINLIFIGIYIISINSLLEEYFWRGFLFNNLEKLIKPWMAYTLTGIAFSFHHVMFYYNWFNLTFFLIVTIGLAIYAIIMNFIFQRNKDLFSCWLAHGMVDVVQIFIAFKIFSLI